MTIFFLSKDKKKANKLAERKRQERNQKSEVAIDKALYHLELKNNNTLGQNLSEIVDNYQIWNEDFENHVNFNYDMEIDVGSQFNFKAQVISILGDGNCMFNAISTALYGDLGHQAHFRKILVLEIEKIVKRMIRNNTLSSKDEWITAHIPFNGIQFANQIGILIDRKLFQWEEVLERQLIEDYEISFVDRLNQHKDYIEKEGSWGTNFDLALLGNKCKIRFGIFSPLPSDRTNYQFSINLPFHTAHCQTWPLVLLHNANLNHYDLIKTLANNDQSNREVRESMDHDSQDDQELMEVDSESNVTIIEEETIPLPATHNPMTVKDQNRVAAKKKKNGAESSIRRVMSNSFEQMNLHLASAVSSRDQRAANRSLAFGANVGCVVKKAPKKDSLPPVKVLKNMTKGCARDLSVTTLEHSLGSLNVVCQICGAVFYEKEKSYKQCCNKHLSLHEFDNYPEDLKDLWTGMTDESKYFRSNSRFFNMKFCFASLNAQQRQLTSHGPPSFVIHGPVYRLFNTSMPSSTQESSYGQLYLYGPERSAELRITADSSDIERALIHKLSEVIARVNLLAKSYKSFSDFVVEEQSRADPDRVNIQSYELRLVDPNCDDRVSNLPTVPEVAAIYYGNDGEDIPQRNDVFVTTKNGRKVNISHMNINRDALTYPLLFCLGNNTYDPNATFNEKRITRITYYQNMLAFRPRIFNPLHYAGYLLQQFIVDIYTTVETDRLNFIRQLNTEQQKVFMSAMEDYMAGDDNEVQGSHFVKLFSSYVGSRRYMNLNYHDCMAIVLKFGKPTFFITMTCNTNWKEIQDNLLVDQKASDRNDLVARVFKHKAEALRKDLKSGALGESVYLTENIEFQKRGLPHCHTLLKISDKSYHFNSTNVDECISAELPPLADKELRVLVLKHMTHNRCDLLKDRAPCWDKRKNECSKKFPYAFQETTIVTTSGKVTYKRSRNNVNDAVDSKGNVITNQWIVPYNRLLLKKYNCHLNIVAVGSISSVKYVFKYAHKGAAKIQINVVGGTKEKKDEVNEFLEARFLGASEAMWRIMEYPMLYKDVVVCRLPIHLPTEPFAVADIESNFTEWSKGSRVNIKSQLDAFYELCAVDEEAKSFTYSQIPTHYCFDLKARTWKRRLRCKKVIGRIFQVSNFQVEKYSLRQLLLHVPGPTSAENLRTIDNIVYETFFEAASALGLVNSDENFDEMMREVSETSFGKEVRNFFALLICYYPEFKNHKAMFEKYVESLTDDYERQYGNQAKAIEQALYDIRTVLDANNYRGESDLPDYNIAVVDLDFVQDPQELLNVGRGMYEKANPKQKEFVTRVLNSVNDQSTQRAYFLQGPAGCGKTFVYLILYYLLRGEGKSVVNCASTGIAATLLPSGQTSHSLFAIPLNILDDNHELSKINKVKMKMLLEADVVIIDEAPMFTKWLLGYIDRRLKDVCKNTLPFGGKVIILGGDFRQILPIIEHSTRSENVNAAIKFSNLWKDHFEVFVLDQNMRVNQEEIAFAKWVLNVGDGKEVNVKKQKITVPELIRSSGNLIADIFENQDENSSDRWNSVILAPTNKAVDSINDNVLENIVPGEVVHLLSSDILKSDPSVANDIQNLPIEYLNSLNPNGMPVHNLKLKVNCIVTVLRNLNIKDGVCNGTRLLVKGINSRVLTCQHIVNPRFGETVLIPRIILFSNDKDFPFSFERKQFPVRLAYAMTINKSQGQTLSRVGLDLEKDCFTHGQLYVALSRVRSPKDLFVSTPNDKMIQTNVTDNIVFKEVLL